MSERIEEILKKIRKIELKSRSLVNEELLGGYHSTFRGQGIEFSDVSEYMYGDDIRNIDWNVTARSGNPYIKKFIEERELSINILVDISASMLYGSSFYSKRELAAEIAGIIAYSALANQDKVGLTLITNKVELYIPPIKGKKNLLRILREILYFKPSSPHTDILKGIDFISSSHTKRQIIFVLSDFFNFSPDNNIYKIAKKRHEIIPIIIGDRRERELFNSGILVVEDLETKKSGIIPLNSLQKIWINDFNNKIKKLKNTFNKIGERFIEINSEDEIIKALREFFS